MTRAGGARAAEARALLDTAQYQAAYESLRAGLLEEPGAPELLTIGRELAERVERWCMELGSDKATEYLPATQRYFELNEKVQVLLRGQPPS